MLRRTILSRPAGTRRSFSTYTSSSSSRRAPSQYHYITAITAPKLHIPKHAYKNNGYLQHIQSRCFFFGGGSDDDGDDGKNNDSKKKKKEDEDGKKEEEKDDDDKIDDNENSEPSSSDDESTNNSDESSPSLDNSARYKSDGGGSMAIDGSSSKNSNIYLPASRLGFGDQAPRYPHLMALPITKAPIFPGVLTPITISDQVSE